MDEPIEEAYFNWLYSKVASIDCPATPSNTYFNLMRQLHSTEYAWLLNGDDNRAADGLELRREFHKILEIHLREEIPWTYIGCSVLEMLIAFSRRTMFQTSISDREWFWIFLHNLGLADLNDAQPDISLYVQGVLETFIWRTYDINGIGGLFPMEYTKRDQRQIEVVYQFFEYLEEQER